MIFQNHENGTLEETNDLKKTFLHNNNNNTFPPVKLTVKLEKKSTINVHMASAELLEACKASCIDDGIISTSTLYDSEFSPPQTPNTILTKDELNPTTTAVYIKDAQVLTSSALQIYICPVESDSERNVTCNN